MEATIDYKSLYEEQQSKLEEQQLKLTALEHELEQLKRLIYAARSERFEPFDPSITHQLSPGLAAEKQQAAAVSKQISYTRIINEPVS